MTDNDDPFGRRDRTIIRPNPGGRRPPPPPGAPGGHAPPRRRRRLPPHPPPPPVAYPPPPYPPPFRRRLCGRRRKAGQANWDGWMTRRRPPVNPYMQQASASGADDAGARSRRTCRSTSSPSRRNPLMRASASLLLLLGRLRASLSRAGAGQLMDQVAQAIQQFEADARAAGAPPDQIERRQIRARRLTADDIVQNLPSDDRQLWTQYSMLVRFFSERTGGVKFFQELDRAKQNPAVNLGLLEVMHACLSLGFEGVYRASQRRRRRRPAGHTPRSLRDDPPRAAQDDRRPFAALARPDHRHRRQPVARAGLGDRRGGRRDPARRLSLLAQPAERRGRSGRA